MSTAQQRQLAQTTDLAGSSIVARCQALGLARSSFYYQPTAETALNLKFMRLLDEEFTRHNFKGVRRLRDHLRLTGYLVNSDQGSQFTCPAFKQALLDAGCRISRDGRGRATDNAFIERLWRTVKWEHIYLNHADEGHHLHQQLYAYFTYYNQRRPHQRLAGQTPAHVYQTSPAFKHSSIS